MIHGLDARVLCGQDIRQSGMWPTDSARADAFVAEFGGTLSVMPVGSVAIAIQWEGNNGESRTVTAASASEAFKKLRRIMPSNSLQD